VRHSHEAEFEAFVRERRGELLATATLLAGGDAHLAEDLVQSSLVRLYLAWGRARTGNPRGYARRILVNATIDHVRRPWVRRENSTDEVPDVAARSPGEVDEDLIAALRMLPPRMRAAVVLRHVQDLSVEDTADALNCSIGNVKSQTARGLDKLRQLLTAPALQGEFR
jgi:RNA polymerase sigma-70 factor (sigma-E family)